MESCHPQAIDLSLGRIVAVAERLKLLAPSARVITVAGTNGKGSFVAALQALLLADGAKVGAYTSPHLLHYNERVVIDGQPVSDDALCAAFEHVDAARQDMTLTYFEFGTLAALWLFAKATLDYLILEVGLGGRLDAVNIIDPDICVLTSIALDHQHWLGDDRESIGREKAGILRPGVPLICVDDEPPESVIQLANAQMCHCYFLGENIHLQSKAHSTQFACCDRHYKPVHFELDEPKLPSSSLLAAAQTYVLLSNQLTSEQVAHCLSGVSLPGRYEKQTMADQHYLLDVAHNPQAAALLAAKLRQEYGQPLVAIFAAMRDKDIDAIVNALGAQVSQWLCCDLANIERSYSAIELAQYIGKQGGVARAYSSVNEAAQAAKRMNETLANENSPILVLGSFYLVAAMKEMQLNDE